LAAPRLQGMTSQGGPPAATERAGPRWAILAIGAAVLVVALVVAVLALGDGTDGAASATASPATPTASESVASASASARTSASAVPSAQAPSPTAAEAAIPGEWVAAATFSEPGRRYVLGDLAAWSGGLLAVGTWYEEEGRGVFGPPPAHEGRIWRSTDGTEWADATPAGTFDQVELKHLFETTDGALIVVGDRWTGPEQASEAWATTDGESWESVVLDGVPAGAVVARVVSNATGHVAVVYTDTETPVLFSADGRLWEGTTLPDAGSPDDVGAGDEGFVGSFFRDDPGGASTAIVASSDGREWLDATMPPDGVAVRVAPRGGDWFAATTSFEEAISVAAWQSADGLDWSPLGDVQLGSFDFGGQSCSEVPGAIHGLPGWMVMGTVLSGCGEGAVVAAGGSYASIDGVVWTRLPFGDQAFAAAAVTIDDRVIVATDTRTNRAENIGVIFWISQAP
jgi:hypothetical protein